MRAFHGRNCIGKVSYASQGGLIKLSSTDGLFEPLIPAWRVLKSGMGSLCPKTSVSKYSGIVLFLALCLVLEDEVWFGFLFENIL